MLAPFRTPFMTGVSQVQVAPLATAPAVVLTTVAAVEDTAPVVASYASLAFRTRSLSTKSWADEAMALVDSFHSLDSLNSCCIVSMKTCHGVLSPWGGGGGGSSFFFSFFLSPASSSPSFPSSFAS